MKKRFLYQILGFSFALIAFSCENGTKQDDVNFDRKAMLENIASNIIVPNYAQLKSDMASLKQSANVFVATPSEVNLNSLKESWYKAYQSWQGCAPFEFGPAMDVSLKSSLNTYPTTTSTIESNISSGNYNLNSVSNLSAIGFPAIEYLLYCTTRGLE